MKKSYAEETGEESEESDEPEASDGDDDYEASILTHTNAHLLNCI